MKNVIEEAWKNRALIALARYILTNGSTAEDAKTLARLALRQLAAEPIPRTDGETPAQYGRKGIEGCARLFHPTLRQGARS